MLTRRALFGLPAALLPVTLVRSDSLVRELCGWPVLTFGNQIVPCDFDYEHKGQHGERKASVDGKPIGS